MSAGSTITAPPLLQRRDGLGHRLRLLRVEPAARLLQARGLDALIVERAWNADACPRQRIAIEKASVVAVRRRQTSLDRILRVRLLAADRTRRRQRQEQGTEGTPDGRAAGRSI